MYRFFASHKKTFFAVAFLVLFSVTVSFATPDANTLDPNCAPTDPACVIALSSSSGWDDMLAQNQIQTIDRSVLLNGSSFSIAAGTNGNDYLFQIMSNATVVVGDNQYSSGNGNNLTIDDRGNFSTLGNVNNNKYFFVDNRAIVGSVGVYGGATDLNYIKLHDSGAVDILATNNGEFTITQDISGNGIVLQADGSSYFNGTNEVRMLNTAVGNFFLLNNSGSAEINASAGGILSLTNTNFGNSISLQADGTVDIASSNGQDINITSAANLVISNATQNNHLTLYANGEVELFSNGSDLSLTSNLHGNGLVIEDAGGVRISGVGQGIQLHPGNTTASILGGPGNINPFSIETVSGNTCTFDTTTGLFSCASDMHLKHDINTIENSALSKIASLRPVTYRYNWQKDTEPLVSGFIAQELEQVFPSMVHTDIKTGYKNLSYGTLMPYIVKAVQELDIKINTITPEGLDATTYGKLKEFLRDIAVESKAMIDTVVAKKVQTQELCIGDTADSVCVTREQLRSLLQYTNSQGSIAPEVPAPAPIADPIEIAPIPASADEVPVVDPFVDLAPEPAN